MEELTVLLDTLKLFFHQWIRCYYEHNTAQFCSICSWIIVFTNAIQLN